MKGKITSNVAQHFFLIIVFIICIAPILLLTLNSIKPSNELVSNPFGIPKHITLSNIVSAWQEGGYTLAMWNSCIVGVFTIIIVCICGGLAGYSLARYDFKGKSSIMAYLLIAMTVPMGLFLVPLFYLWQKLHLMDSLLGLIIIYVGIFLPFCIFLLRSFFVGIPKELAESAKVDGCNELQVFTRIYLPLSKPAFLTVSLIVGLWSWNEFFFANAFIQSDELKTVATRYLTFVGAFSSDWSKVSAAGFVSILPILILYFFLQRKFIDGLVEGSIK